MLPPGRHSTEFIAHGVRRRFGSRWPDEALYLVAVRRRDGRRVAFGRDGDPQTDVAHAVAASVAIPGFFRPVCIDGDEYVDGGVHSPTNADLLAGGPLDAVVVSSPMSLDPRGVRPRPDLGLRWMWHRTLCAETRTVQRTGIPVVTVEPGGALLATMGLRPLRGMRVEEIEEGAYTRTVDVLLRPANAAIVRLLGGARTQRTTGATGA
jgi:NTE family protein